MERISRMRTLLLVPVIASISLPAFAQTADSRSTPRPQSDRAAEAETGLATGWKQCGSLSVARTPERMTYLRRSAAISIK